MTRLLLAVLATGILTSALLPTARAQSPDLNGTWIGSLDVGVTMRLVFHISDSTGAWTATMDSPDQGATGIPMDAVTVRGDSVHLNLAMAGAYYEGVYTQGDSLDGRWVQGGRSFPLVLARSEGPVVMNRPQEPKPPFPYHVEEVTFENPEADGVTLAGTLTLPDGPGPHPALVMVTGSGAQNRDEELLGHKPFLVLADYLARRGVGMLRFDDRGVGESTGNFITATSADFAKDATAAVRFLAARGDVRSDAIGVGGHSEGGLIAPMVAVRAPEVDFVVLLAGPGMRGDSILYDQGELILRAEGTEEERVQLNKRQQKEMFDVVMNEADADKAAAALREILDTRVAGMTDEQKAEAGITDDNVDEMLDNQVQRINSPWFRYFLTYDPVPVLQQVTQPVLAVNGEKDLQVPSKANLAAIERAVRAGGNDQVTVIEFHGLNHLFQTADTGSPSEYSRIEETMSEVMLQAVADWIAETVGITDQTP